MYSEDDAVELIGYLTRSKAIWKNPELLDLVESARSPTEAYARVFKSTGSQKKAKAGRWYACAIRDYGKDSLGALMAVLNSPQGAEKLEVLLTTTFPDSPRRNK
jgi:hypothetical protein